MKPKGPTIERDREINPRRSLEEARYVGTQVLQAGFSTGDHTQDRWRLVFVLPGLSTEGVHEALTEF